MINHLLFISVHFVDEVDDGHYSDMSYWKGIANNIVSDDNISDILNELTL